MDFMFTVVPILSILVFLLTFGFIFYNIIRSVKQERKINHLPRLTVLAKVVTKRTNFHQSSGRNNHLSSGHTTYFATFEVRSGDRMELQLQGTDYGLLVEGDYGELTFQGTRFLGFERKAEAYDL